MPPRNTFAVQWKFDDEHLAVHTRGPCSGEGGRPYPTHLSIALSGQLKNKSCCRFSRWAQRYLVISPQEQQQKLRWRQWLLSLVQLPESRCQYFALKMHFCSLLFNSWSCWCLLGHAMQNVPGEAHRIWFSYKKANKSEFKNSCKFEILLNYF